MSRHRNVRAMNIEDEYDGYDEVYGHSVEDDYCVSPSTAAQFMWNRDQGHSLSAFMKKEENIPEEEELVSDEGDNASLSNSRNFRRPQLDDEHEAMLNSCLEGIRDVLGDTVAEYVMVEAIIQHNFDMEKTLDFLLARQEKPKDQRVARENRPNQKQDEFIGHLVGHGTPHPSSCQYSPLGHNTPHPTQKHPSLGQDTSSYDTPNLRSSHTLLGHDRPPTHNSSTMPNMQDIAAGKYEKPMTSKGLSQLFSTSNTKGDQVNATLSSTKPVSLSDLAAQHQKPSPLMDTQHSKGQGCSNTTSSTSKSTTKHVRLSDLATQHQNVQNSDGRDWTKSTSSMSKKGTYGDKNTASMKHVSLSDLASQHQKMSPMIKVQHTPGFAYEKKTRLTASNNVSPNNNTSDGNLPDEREARASPSLAELAKMHNKDNQAAKTPLADLAISPCQFRQPPSELHLKDLVGQHHFHTESHVQGFTNSVDHSLSDLLDEYSLKSDSKSSSSAHRLDLTSSIITKSKNGRRTKQAVIPCSLDQIYISSNSTELIDQSLSSNLEEQVESTKLTIPDGFYSKTPSKLGKIVCSFCILGRKPKEIINGDSSGRGIRYINFSYSKQVGEVQKQDSFNKRTITPFTFNTPSPDDIVKEKQKDALKYNPGQSKVNFSVGTVPITKTVTPVRSKNDVAETTTRLLFNKIDDKGSKPKPVSSSSSSKIHKGFTVKDDNAIVSGFERKKSSLLREVKSDVDLVRLEERLGASSTGSSRSSTPQKLSEMGSSTSLHKSASKAKQINIEEEYEKRKAGKELLNMIVIGHVDAGKSTLMGHLLYQIGYVNKRTMHKYEQDSKKLGKASFAFAWVLDETEEERSRGVTMDVAKTRFETPTKDITLLDAPGHKDFIPNMITGASQADVAILVVNATRGEFETGFESGGQTREHALLVRSLGVSQLIVAINKMDTVDWMQDRYTDIVQKLGHFLKQAGFKDADLSYIPCSGLSGENLTKHSDESSSLYTWYKGPTLVHQIDQFRAPKPLLNKPFRMCVADVFKGIFSGFCISGKIEAGTVQTGDKVLVMPLAETATVKGITLNDYVVNCGFSGDHVVITITGIDMTNISIGNVLCDSNNPINVTSRLKGRIVVFNIDVPLTRGYPVVFHYQSMSEPASIRKLVSQLHKSTGEVVKSKPRCLTKNSSAVIEIEIGRPICIELYKDFKDLGRFMLRSGGHTIAAGLVIEIMEAKSTKQE